jgi:hypothetical protein
MPFDGNEILRVAAEFAHAPVGKLRDAGVNRLVRQIQAKRPTWADSETRPHDPSLSP